ncbi:MAG: hypothetical protein QME77_10405 [bacterium]|nr:hypothetical protein [bacterium]
MLRDVMKGQPAAAITPLTEDGLEDFILEHSPKVRKLIAEAEADLNAGRVVSLDAYLSRRSGR